MANQTLIPQHPQQRRTASSAADHDGRVVVELAEEQYPRLRCFPEKLPPLELTSQPVKVREIWGRDTTIRSKAPASR